MKKLIKQLLPIADIMLMVFVYPAAWLLKQIRRAGLHRLPLCKRALMHVGVFPIRDHYYEPQFDHRNPNPDFFKDRHLPGIDWNVAGQLEMLEKFCFAQELANIPQEKPDSLKFYLNNGTFESGDAEYWYQLIRLIKPKRLSEVGSGNSTLMAINAINQNRDEDSGYRCEHVCIEPYEMPWLEQAGVSVLRKKVEDVELSFFAQLQAGDILFIDSSHIIRPQGDVLFEFLELLLSLNRGVIVHVHDIFSPKNYLRQWLQDDIKFWNEQYLLEAFLTHYKKLNAVAPFLTPEREPGSFYMQKIA